MVSKEISINNPTGLHARPATMVAKKAAQFKSEVSLQVGEKLTNAKSLKGILSLGANKGTNIKIIASGEDEALALAEIIKFIEEMAE